jgi:hypothetical protein
MMSLMSVTYTTQAYPANCTPSYQATSYQTTTYLPPPLTYAQTMQQQRVQQTTTIIVSGPDLCLYCGASFYVHTYICQLYC